MTETPGSLQEEPLGTSEVAEPTVAETTGPWPATFTPEQTAWSQEAWTAWLAYDDVARQALAAPSPEWVDQLRTVAVGPRLESTIDSVLGMAENQVRQTGSPEYELVEVRLALIDRVEMLLCSDVTPVEVVYSDGRQIPVDKANPRSLVEIVVVRDQAGSIPWMLAELRSSTSGC